MRRKGMSLLEVFLVLGFLALVLVGAMAVECAAGLAGCAGAKPVPDNGSVDNDADACAAACANLERLRCPGWRGSLGKDEIHGTEDDVPCEQVCRDVVEASVASTLHQKCTAAADSCAAVERCFEEDY